MRVGQDYYKFHNSSGNSASSIALCQADGAQLATMIGMEERSALLAVVSKLTLFRLGAIPSPN